MVVARIIKNQVRGRIGVGRVGACVCVCVCVSMCWFWGCGPGRIHGWWDGSEGTWMKQENEPCEHPPREEPSREKGQQAQKR